MNRLDVESSASSSTATRGSRGSDIARGSRRSRLLRAITDRAWLHMALVCGVAIFLFPMLWMVAVSLKSDEELTDPGWLPRLPAFIAKSPYVLPPVKIARPMVVDEKVWDRMLPLLLRETRAAVEEAAARAADSDVDRAAHVEAAAPVLVGRLASRVPADLWSGDEGMLLEAYRALLTADATQQALDERLARFELRGILLRSLDGRLFELCDASQAADRIRVESGPARIERDRAGRAHVHYEFDSAASEPVVLSFGFVSAIEPNQLHKLLVGYVGDASWHRVDATLTIGDATWESQRTTYLAQHRAGSMIFQPPSFDDQTFKNRVWVPMKATDKRPSPHPSPSGLGEGVKAWQAHSHDIPPPQRGELRLIIHPSSTFGAVIGKIQFNYSRAFRAVPFWKYVINSLILVVLITVGTLFSSTFVAYAFARLRWPGRTVAFVILLATMMLPTQVTMIPSFVIWRQLGWYNTFNPLWVPAFFGGAFFIFLMVQHMKTIPRDLEEAARIDGLNALQTWWYVIVPLVKPAAAAIAIMTVMGAWNEFMGPLIYLRDQGKFPLSLGLFAMRIDSGAQDWTMIMAGNVLMTLPMIAMFIVFQRQFIQGMTMSGIKA